LRSTREWFRIEDHHLVVTATTKINLGGTVGCFFSSPSGAVLVICRDGYVVRVAVPQ
jgi:hypothetical protein